MDGTSPNSISFFILLRFWLDGCVKDGILWSGCALFRWGFYPLMLNSLSLNFWRFWFRFGWVWIRDWFVEIYLKIWLCFIFGCAKAGSLWIIIMRDILRKVFLFEVEFVALFVCVLWSSERIYFLWDSETARTQFFSFSISSVFTWWSLITKCSSYLSCKLSPCGSCVCTKLWDDVEFSLF